MSRVNVHQRQNRVLVVALAMLLVHCTSGTGAGDAADAAVSADAPDASGEDTALVCDDPDDDGYGPGCALGAIDCAPNNPQVSPAADEACGDGVDNDCDGDIDEGCACETGRIERCYEGPSGTAGIGICVAGARVCTNGVWSTCDGQTLPESDSEAQCDNRDEDCDGEIDEGLTNACGECGALSLELCGDGLDNDCDGLVDPVDAGCDCSGRRGQPCYTGPPATLGVGQCRGGVADCEASGELGVCVGELLPSDEVCDGVDNDCDGEIDEGIRNACGVCGVPTPVELCNGLDDDCDGVVDNGVRLACGLCPGEQGPEVCEDGLDNDCDGEVDEQCSCTSGVQACYPGPVDTLGVGECRAGVRSCDASGEFWGACTAFVLPTLEVCNGRDDDCDGTIDISPNGCALCDIGPEICDGIDNDCDGEVDEGRRNRCGECFEDVVPETECNGADDDCDGLIDEGLLNACGLCGESCFITEWAAPDEWLTGRFDGVDDQQLDAGLQLGASRLALPDIWIANTAEGTVTRIDTDTAAVVGTYPVGADPSRTAVDFDGDVYVANRAFDGQGSVTKIQRDGCEGAACVLWTTEVGEPNAIPRGLAIDAEGYPWVGTFNDGRLRRLNPVTGAIEREVDTGVSIYGLAIDGDGIIWVSTISSAGLAAYDIARDRIIGAWPIPNCGTPYGIAVDAVGAIWLGSFRCDTLVRFDRTPGGSVQIDAYSDPNLRETRGVAVDASGAVYVAASGTDRLGRFDPDTQSFAWTQPTCADPIGVGIARDGNIWVACNGSDTAEYFSPDGERLGAVSVGDAPYSYSDLTGFQLRNFTAPAGVWAVTFDCGFADCGFDRLVWESLLPAGTTVEARARSRVRDDSAWSDWTPWFSPSPAPIAGALPRGQFAEVEVRLSTQDRAITPVVPRVTLEWQRP